MNLLGWTVKQGRLWGDVRIWTPQVYKWVLFVGTRPLRVRIQRVLTDREFDALMAEYSTPRPKHNGKRWGWG